MLRQPQEASTSCQLDKQVRIYSCEGKGVRLKQNLATLECRTFLSATAKGWAGPCVVFKQQSPNPPHFFPKQKQTRKKVGWTGGLSKSALPEAAARYSSGLFRPCRANTTEICSQPAPNLALQSICSRFSHLGNQILTLYHVLQKIVGRSQSSVGASCALPYCWIGLANTPAAKPTSMQPSRRKHLANCSSGTDRHLIPELPLDVHTLFEAFTISPVHVQS